MSSSLILMGLILLLIRILVLPNHPNNALGGSSFRTLDRQRRGWGTTWLPEWAHDNQKTWAHEMGHGFGLLHSSGPYGQDGPSFSPSTYDSDWDVMSGGQSLEPYPGGYGYLGVHTIAYHKDFLGWIPPDRKYTAAPNSTRTITLERLAQPSEEGYLMAQIPIGRSPTDFYTVEARLFAGYDDEIPDEAIVIHTVDTTRGDRLAQVVDVDNNGDPNDAGAMWTFGEIFTDVENNLQISIDVAYASSYRVTINTDPTTFTVAQAGANDLLFEDDMESGTDGWFDSTCGLIIWDEDSPWCEDSPWAQTTAASRSGTHSWTDSPSGYQGQMPIVGLWSPVIDLTEAESATLTFWHRYDFDGTAWGSVWVAPQREDGEWRANKHLRTFAGTRTIWTQASMDLSPFVGEPIRIAFSSQSLSKDNTADGWYIDDIAVFSSDSVPQALLENPSRNSSQSGVGVISGWACHANEIVIELDGKPLQAAYGTVREDTRRVCGDTDNGFSLLWNWNNLGTGTHTVRALIDGAEFANTTVQVTTFGEKFLRGASGVFELPKFPAFSKTTVVRWEEALQNFVITDGSPARGGGYNRVAGIDAILENPSLGSAQSGVGVISGWACEAEEIVIELDGTPLQAAYGTVREDTRSVCGDTDNGFSLLWNWNNLGAGTHAVRALIDGVEFADTTVQVTTFGEQFLRGVSGTFPISDFPRPGETKRLRWEEALQNFVIIP